MSGAAIMTERATSFSGFRHSSEKMAAPSKPPKAAMAILVNTFSVTMEAAGQARESDARTDGSPAAKALAKRRASTKNVATVNTEPMLLHHFARYNPRTL